MIHQIAPVTTEAEPHLKINKALLQARHIQANVKTGKLPTHVNVWSPITAGPYLVPVTRWIE